MDIFTLALVFCLSFLFGVSIVNYLTVHPLRMSNYAILSTLLLVWIVSLTNSIYLVDGIEAGVAIFLSFWAFLLGYSVATTKVLSMEDFREVPDITRNKDDPGKGHTAVVYFTHGEPETYHPIGWINQFREFDEQKLPFIPYLIRPFFLYQLRKKYLKVGKSDHRKMHQIMIKQLEEKFRSSGDKTTKFYLSFLDDDPRPDAAAIQALNEGASKIVVCEVFVSISNHTREGEALIKELKLEDYGIDITFTRPLWDSSTLHQMFIQNANAVVGEKNRSKVGVLLVGHGQPDEWDIEFPTETEHEIQFREKILKLFVEAGYSKDNLALAWMEFKDPKPAGKIQQFVDKGVKTILYFATSISADAIHSLSDIPDLVYEADVPEDVKLFNMGAWNNDPIAIKAIQERIQEKM